MVTFFRDQYKIAPKCWEKKKVSRIWKTWKIFLKMPWLYSHYLYFVGLLYVSTITYTSHHCWHSSSPIVVGPLTTIGLQLLTITDSTNGLPSVATWLVLCLAIATYRPLILGHCAYQSLMINHRRRYYWHCSSPIFLGCCH